MTQAATTTKKEILVTGFGGQGVVLIGSILGKAAALGDRRESTQVQSYGPESRGGTPARRPVHRDRKSPRGPRGR